MENATEIAYRPMPGVWPWSWIDSTTRASVRDVTREELAELISDVRANRVAIGGPCQYFARCDRDASTLTPHPILGAVPACERCATFATS